MTLVGEVKHVVRFKCGDPGVFARAREETEACDNVGVAVEIVPGITSVSAAAAQFGDTLMERHRIDAITLATARDALGNPATQVANLRPGASVAYYMGIKTAPDLEAVLLAQCPADLPCTIVMRAGYENARRVTTPLSGLAQSVSEHGITHPAILFVSWPRDHAVALHAPLGHAETVREVL